MILLSLLLWGVNTFTSTAQSNFELGLRVGDQPGSSVAFDMTIPIDAAPRLHPTLYLANGGVGIGAYFDWMFAVVNGPTGLKIYPGVGPELFLFNDVEFGASGDFGVEYTFEFPLTIGLDWRPGFTFTDGLDFHTNNFGFMARFWIQALRLKRVN